MILFYEVFQFFFCKVFLWSGPKLGVAKTARSPPSHPFLDRRFFLLNFKRALIFDNSVCEGFQFFVLSLAMKRARSSCVRFLSLAMKRSDRNNPVVDRSPHYVRDDNLLTDKRTCASRHCQAKRVSEKTQLEFDSIILNHLLIKCSVKIFKINDLELT